MVPEVVVTSTAALGGRVATAGFGVKPRENKEGRGGAAAPRSGAKRRPDFWRAALVSGSKGSQRWVPNSRLLGSLDSIPAIGSDVVHELHAFPEASRKLATCSSSIQIRTTP